MRLLSLWIAVLVTQISAQAANSAEDQSLITRKHTNVVALVSGANDANVARLVCGILEHTHYLRKPFNDEVSSRFFDRYLDALDNLHIYFLQSDVREFEAYRNELDDLTKRGDLAPARFIFDRFRLRLDQQYDYAMEVLKKDAFDFTSDERYVVNRKEMPRPKDMGEAQQLWRERVRFEYLQEKLNKEKPEEIVKIITRRYNRVLRFLHEYDNDDVMQIYLTALSHVYDPHSDYMGKSEFDNFSINMRLSLFGIGALLRSEDGMCRIQSLTPEGPAEKSQKLKANDKIIAVAQSNQPPVEVIDLPLRKVVELIRGPKNTEVRLTIIPADADSSVRKVISLIRDEIKLEDQAAKARVYEVPSGKNETVRLGVIDLPSFYSSFDVDGRKSGLPQKSTTDDVARLLTRLMKENVAGIVLDLRRNGGGSLEEAIRLTGLFIDEGPVVQVKDTSGRVIVDSDVNDPQNPYPGEFYRGPLIVLTSRFSASASEILAGALQDYDRALIVGDSSTHGKGTVQSLIQLAPYLRSSGITTTNNPGAVKITIRKFYRASGQSTQLRGVTPDIVLPSLYNDAKIGEDAFDNPMEWDTIPGASHQKLGRITPSLEELKRRSVARVSRDQDFAFLMGEAVRAKKARDEKSVSVNEKQRLKEKQEADDRAKARKKELAARPEPAGKVYEFTMKNLDLPGLPPPLARTNLLASSGTNRVKLGTKGGVDTPGVSTNRPGSGAGGQASHESGPKEDAAESNGDDSTPPLDVTLEETKRILLDLISVASQNGSLAGKTAPEKK